MNLPNREAKNKKQKTKKKRGKRHQTKYKRGLEVVVK